MFTVACLSSYENESLFHVSWFVYVTCSGKVCVGDCSTAKVSVADGYDFALSCPTLFCVGKGAFVYFFCCCYYEHFV